MVQAAQRTDRKTKPAVMVKVSPDEDSDEQVLGICDAVWQSGVDGVIVGNTTKRRPDPFPEGYTLSQREAIAVLEQGGYSGPQLFDRTVKLTRRYRMLLDEGMGQEDALPNSNGIPDVNMEPASTPDRKSDISTQIEATIARDAAHMKPSAPKADADSKSQPLIRIPERNKPFSSSDSSSTNDSPALSSSSHIEQLPDLSAPLPPQTIPLPSSPKQKQKRKVIFATGGITNGAQALEVLEAGASVTQVYTALVYGGAGTITRMKGEMRDEMKRRRNEP